MAIDPRAFGLDFATLATSAAPFERAGDVAIVDVCGPLVHGASWMFDTYEAITARVRAAFADNAVKAVVLRVDSPGGDVHGAFDAARAIRAAADAAGKPFLAHTAAQMCSSAYALSCAADKIFATDTAVVGSVGVIATAVDTTVADAAQGVRFAFVTSGERKADGNPHAGLTDTVVAAMQSHVDAMAAVFFAHVQARRGFDPQPLQAGVFIGADAVARKLADAVMSFDECVALAIAPAAGNYDKAMADDADKDKDKPKEDATRAGLVTAAESDDPDKASRAKRALAAYDTEEDDKKDDDKKDDKASAAVAASASVNPAVASLVASVQALTAEVTSLKAVRAADEFAALKASRPDIAKAVWAAVEKLPFASAKAVVDATPKAAAPSAPELERAPVQGGFASMDLAAAGKNMSDPLSLRMGIGAVSSTGVKLEHGILSLGVPTPVSK